MHKLINLPCVRAMATEIEAQKICIAVNTSSEMLSNSIKSILEPVDFQLGLLHDERT